MEGEKETEAPAVQEGIVISQKTIPILLFALLTGATGLGGYGVWQSSEIKTDPSARADPWTGTDARRQAYELRSEMLTYVAQLHREIDEIETRVDTLESRCAVVTDRLERILRVLEGK
jgi:hypothetical protein